MKTPLKSQYTVSIELAYGETAKDGPIGKRDIAAYIRDAVKTMGGGKDPEDVLFSRNIKRVIVRPISTDS